MTPRIRHAWTAADKARALDLYREHGLAAALRLFREETGLHLSKSTLSDWRRQFGATTTAPDRAAAAREALEAKTAVLRAELQALLLEKAVGLMKRIDEPHIDYKSAGPLGPVQVVFPVAPPAACQHYATSVGILIDKYRLEHGEVTGREEVITVDTVDREIAKLNEELARRGAFDAGPHTGPR